MVVLKRLSDAQKEGDRILALIPGSALNQDGRSGGLTVPNGPAQERVLADALSMADIEPAAVQYVEAHGTGTELGDPIEVQALAAALGTGRSPQQPLLVGSVKTNIGHLEGSAGIAGLIKVVLALQAQEIPPHLHFQKPNPHIPWTKLPIQVPCKRVPWPAGNGRRIAGVSSFGFSGTNAHVVIEAAPPTAPAKAKGQTEPPRPRRPQHVLALSARSESALRELAQRYGSFLETHPEADLADVCFSANTGRSHFEHRAAIIAESNDEASVSLQAMEEGKSALCVQAAGALRRPKVAFLFTGQGSQYAGMAQELYSMQPAFRTALDRCAELLRGVLERPLLKVLWEDAAMLEQTAYAQPGLFAVEYALAELWRSWGIVPEVLLGHSVGEYVAACLAGVFSLEDGLRLIVKRAQLMQALPSGGAMAAVFAPPTRLEQALTQEPAIAIAAHNGSHTVLSGPSDILEKVLTGFAQEGIKSRRLATSHAFHSALLEPMLGAFETFAQTLKSQPATRTLVSNLTGKVLGADQTLDAGYWKAHARQPVQFARSLDTLVELGCQVLVEVGPAPILLSMAEHAWPRSKPAPVLVPTLRPGKSDNQQMAAALAHLYVQGLTPDFIAWDKPWPRCRLELPTYPFQRQRYWVECSIPAADGAIDKAVHPLLGSRQRSAVASRGTCFEQPIRMTAPAWLRDHRVLQEAVFPGAGYVELALAAASTLSSPAVVEQLLLREPLLLREGKACWMQTVITSGENGAASLEIFSQQADDRPWTLHASARIEPAGDVTVPQSVNLTELRANCSRSLDGADFYKAADATGLHYGPTFRTVERLHIGANGVLARVRLAVESAEEGGSYHIHPALLDGCFQCLAASLTDETATYLVLSIERIRLWAPAGAAVWCHVHFRDHTAEQGHADIRLLNDGGEILAEITGLLIRRANPTTLLRVFAGQATGDLLYSVQWHERDSTRPEPRDTAGTWLLFTDRGEEGAALVEGLEGRHQKCVRVEAGSRFAALSVVRYALDPTEPTDFDKLLQTVRTANLPPLRGVAFLWGISADPNPAAEMLSGELQRLLGGCLHAAQALLRQGCIPQDGLWLLTRGAQAVGSSPSAMHVAASLWGFGRVLAVEHPELRTALLDLDPQAAQPNLGSKYLADALLAGPGEAQQAWREGKWYVPRLLRLRLPTASTNAPVPGELSGDATYLITGGLGALGLAAVQWLAQRGARHLVLTSRREPEAAAQQVLAQLQAQGCAAHVKLADVGDAREVERLLNEIDTGLPPLRGVIHAAGMLDDGIVQQQEWRRFQTVLAPKALGAWFLHEQTLGQPLDFFILYSSAATLLGSPGQSNYAAANAFLDGLAHKRRAAGLPALSINWGPWADRGMAATSAGQRRWQAQGWTPLEPGLALTALEQVLTAETAQTAILNVDWDRFTRALDAQGRPPLVQDLLSRGKGSSPTSPELLNQLRPAAPAERAALLTQYLQVEVRRVLSLSTLPDPQRGFFEMGMDSLMAVELRNRLQDQLGSAYPLPSTLVFEFSTVETLASHLLQEVLKLEPPQSVAASIEEQAKGDTIDEELSKLSEDELNALLDAEIADKL